ncbi:hypothetical protein MPH_05821 [Macrophomina phaseolina MS6]|uniref:Uncharacterized protein n=1 Tax=Macrophomina phaseolina (strain MS6) TaxID=1126212 RepID=K2SJK8_MACPH|nr:hypothetical protein MPH_05821 [Macrophomina phaseolina MS6]
MGFGDGEGCQTLDFDIDVDSDGYVFEVIIRMQMSSGVKDALIRRNASTSDETRILNVAQHWVYRTIQLETEPCLLVPCTRGMIAGKLVGGLQIRSVRIIRCWGISLNPGIREIRTQLCKIKRSFQSWLTSPTSIIQALNAWSVSWASKMTRCSSSGWLVSRGVATMTVNRPGKFRINADDDDD